MLEKLDGIEQRLSHLEQEADLVRGRLERRGGHRMAEVRRTSTPKTFRSLSVKRPIPLGEKEILREMYTL